MVAHPSAAMGHFTLLILALSIPSQISSFSPRTLFRTVPHNINAPPSSTALLISRDSPLNAPLLGDMSLGRGLGLSRANQRLLTDTRQRFIPLNNPLYVRIAPSPKRRWLSGPASSAVTINGTAIELSPANYGAVMWIDEGTPTYSLELLAEIRTKSPAYLSLIPNPVKERDELWVTDFSLTSRAGGLTRIDPDTGEVKRLKAKFPWPNEVGATAGRDAVIVSDGFLVPGRADGGVFAVVHPGKDKIERKVKLSDERDGWYYHRAVWVDLTGDGRLSILAARARRPNANSVSSMGELVWLERPKPPKYSEETGEALELDGSKFDEFSDIHTPWKTTKLCNGPDVMFSVADLDPKDDTIEVIASEFFGKKVSLHSIRIHDGLPSVVFSREIDSTCGSAYSCVLGDLGVSGNTAPTVIDAGSTVEHHEAGDSFTHVLVTSHECTYDNRDDEHEAGSHSSTTGYKHYSGDEVRDGGQLFAYRVPVNWRNELWHRSCIASGFKCKTTLNINPGAPGFVYLFHPNKNDPSGPPHIALSGDGAEAAFIFRPSDPPPSTSNLVQHLNEHSQRLGVPPHPSVDPKYSLMCEVDCGATVGSLAVSYDSFCAGQSVIYCTCVYIVVVFRECLYLLLIGRLRNLA